MAVPKTVNKTSRLLIATAKTKHAKAATLAKAGLVGLNPIARSNLLQEEARRVSARRR
jgi:hypothetical protein